MVFGTPLIGGVVAEMVVGVVLDSSTILLADAMPGLEFATPELFNDCSCCCAACDCGPLALLD